MPDIWIDGGEDWTVAIGQPVLRKVCTDMPRQEWWVISEILRKSVVLRKLVDVSDDSGVSLSDLDLDFEGFAGTIVSDEVLEILHSRIGAQDLDGLGHFAIWTIAEDLDFESEAEVFKRFKKLLKA